MSHTKVELKIKCNDLPNLDYLSKSDPKVYLLFGDESTHQFNDNLIKDSTELIKDQLNPEFVKSFILNFKFEEFQPLRFIIVDVDNFDSEDWKKQEYIGKFDCNLAQIVSSPNSKLTGSIHNERKQNKKGSITIFCEELLECKQNLSLQVSGANIPFKKSLFSKSIMDTYFTISKSREDLNWVVVYKSEHSNKSEYPNWKGFEISLSKLCNGDLNRQLRFELVRSKTTGEQINLGHVEISIQSLLTTHSQTNDTISLVLPNQSIKLLINKIELIPGPLSFLDYLRFGTQINLAVSIDFTQSNGNVHDKNSLHYVNNNELNQYEKAIKSVGEILVQYDKDHNIPVYGFGGRVNNQVSHCFPLNGNPSNPEVYEVNGILDVYRQAIRNVELWGPTNFSPSIQQMINMIHQFNQPQNYYVLLILTDGAITDMEATAKTIVDGSKLPLSIIIIGVGNADFGKMDILDGDDQILSYNQQQASRDIVQFVPFRQFQNHKSKLAQAVLEEIPQQLCSYFRIKNIIPILPPDY